MSFQVRTAERKKAKLKLGVSGPSGSGKTYSSLLLANGIAGSWEKITIIDTENGSGELYSALGLYKVIHFEPPFDPRRYIEAIRVAVESGAEVVVIDSISHEWDGVGGCLDIQNKLGGKYQDWARVTPMHKAFVDTILQAPVHVIVTTRKKQDYEMVSENGKAKVQKMGLKEIQRDGFEYELAINFDVEISHFATASKDRTGLFMPRGPFKISQDTGKELMAWANAAKEVAVEPANPLEEDPFAVVSPTSIQLPPIKSTQPSSSTTHTTNGQTQATTTASPATTTKRFHVITDKQRGRLWGIAKDNGWQERDLKDYLFTKYGLDTTKNILNSEYDALVEFVKSHPIKPTDEMRG